jgi:hypothetical protein
MDFDKLITDLDAEHPILAQRARTLKGEGKTYEQVVEYFDALRALSKLARVPTIGTGAILT